MLSPLYRTATHDTVRIFGVQSPISVDVVRIFGECNVSNIVLCAKQWFAFLRCTAEQCPHFYDGAQYSVGRIFLQPDLVVSAFSVCTAEAYPCLT